MNIRELLKSHDKVYSMAEFEDMDCLHIFEGSMQLPPKKGCTAKNKSCCGKVDRSEHENVKFEFQCLDSKEALTKCINIKKPICAGCEQHVFKQFQLEHNRRE